MPDGSVIHAFARKISDNPVKGLSAVAVAVLSITDPDEGATYAGIARALASDYYNIYYVDLETERFIEYTSPVGGEELAMERHGTNFFAAARRDTQTRIYEEDREPFLCGFTKENVLRELDEQGVYTATYRLIDTGTPMYASMKAMRMKQDGRHLIIGISIVDARMKQQEAAERLQAERTAYARLAALADDYLSLYTIDPETGGYTEYSATDAYANLGFARTGDDFFRQGIVDGMRTVYGDDLPLYLSRFNRETVLRDIEENGCFLLEYRLVLDGKPTPVRLKIVRVREGDGDKLIAGVKA